MRSLNKLNSISLEEKYTAKCPFTCDKWNFGNFGVGIENSEINFSEYGSFVKSSFIRNCEFFSSGNLPYTIQGLLKNSLSHGSANPRQDVFGGKSNSEENFPCYIDGDYTFEGSYADFINTDKNLEVGAASIRRL